MATPRRKCRLADISHADIDHRNYSKVIIETIEQVIPGKNPRVYKEYFSTDPLTQREAISIGMALAKIPALSQYGKTITTFRLFDGKTYASEYAKEPITKLSQKGGRLK